MFTREMYDKNAYLVDIAQSAKPQSFLLQPETTHLGSRTCYQEIVEMHPEPKQLRVSDPNAMMNIESDLYNLNRPNSKDPMQHYPFIQQAFPNEAAIPACGQNADFDFIYPKLEGSQWNREKSINIQRFESLCLNPQMLARIRSNNVIGANTRLYHRDNYRPNIPLPPNQSNTWGWTSTEVPSSMKDFATTQHEPPFANISNDYGPTAQQPPDEVFPPGLKEDEAGYYNKNMMMDGPSNADISYLSFGDPNMINQGYKGKFMNGNNGSTMLQNTYGGTNIAYGYNKGPQYQSTSTDVSVFQV